jgi:DNA-binding response OmpR family regulator
LESMAAPIAPDPPYVLLIEADQVLAESVGEALYASGFVPLLATDAADAVRYMAGASVPVLIILDLDSVEEPAMLARFKADARWAQIPVVVTGSAAELPGDLPVDAFLPKPFDTERLVSLARESIARLR